MKKSVVILAAIILLMTACVPAQSQSGSDVQGQIETSVALTVEAQGQVGTSVTLTTEAQDPTETATATATFTPTALIPTITPLVSTVTPLPPPSGGSGSGGIPPKADYACDIIHQRPFDNTEFNPGEEFDIKWTILNTGTKSWYEGFDLKYLSGPNMTTTGITRIQLPAMDPGDQYDVVFDAKAPMKKGVHIMTWLVDGPTCYPYVAIVVK